MTGFKDRLGAASIHLGLSLTVAALSALLVFQLWFPSPFNEVAGGRDLFMLIVGVDLGLGPLLTFLVFNRKKSSSELRTDIGLIVLVQLIALGYGLWTVFMARPVYLVHEVDRFQVVTASDVDPDELKQALSQFQQLPLFGMQVIGVRQAQSEEEKMYSIDQALAGKDVSFRPGWWSPLGKDQMMIMQKRGRSVASYQKASEEAKSRLHQLLKDHQLADDAVWVFPLVGRTTSWSVVVEKADASIVGYLPIDSFEVAGY